MKLAQMLSFSFKLSPQTFSEIFPKDLGLDGSCPELPREGQKEFANVIEQGSQTPGLVNRFLVIPRRPPNWTSPISAPAEGQQQQQQLQTTSDVTSKFLWCCRASVL